MKKSLLTLSLVALFSIASKAQDTKTKKETNPTPVPVSSSVEKAPEASTTKQEEPKKGGTRMAINEKGLPGSSKAPKKEAAKEEKTATPGQPGAATQPNSTKKDK